VAVDSIGSADRLKDALRGQFRVIAARGGFLDQDELVASHPNDEIALARNRPQPPRNGLEQGIPHGVTELVIGCLEMIEVDRVDRNHTGLGFAEHSNQIAVQNRAIERAGHRINPGELLELPFQRHLIDG
jgi:hypothetical protein